MLTAGANWSKPEDKYTLGVGGRYYFDKCGIYLGAGLKMNRYNWKVGDTTDFAFDAEAGYAFFLTRTVTIEPAVYYDLSFKDSDLSKFGLKVGFGFYFWIFLLKGTHHRGHRVTQRIPEGREYTQSVHVGHP